MRLTGKVFFVLLFLAACSGKEKSLKIENSYFSLQKYFENEASRLFNKQAKVLKSVSFNGNEETKSVSISDWKTELELFTQSDINKPAWKDSYRIVKGANTIEYISHDPELRTSSIKIDWLAKGRKIRKILIHNNTSNFLYTSTEELIYYPDSLYTVRKVQHVRIIGSNEYTVSSKFLPSINQ